VLEGRVWIGECGCWRIYAYSGVLLRSYRCSKHGEEVLDFLEYQLYLDKVSSVSAATEDGRQLWLEEG